MATDDTPIPLADDGPPSVDNMLDLQRVRARKGLPSTGPIFPDPFEPLYGPAGKPLLRSVPTETNSDEKVSETS